MPLAAGDPAVICSSSAAQTSTGADNRLASFPTARTGSFRAYMELSKIRLCVLVAMSAAAGYGLALQGVQSWGQFALAVAGTLLAAMGANAFNQIIERDRDALMERTRRRPLPEHRLTKKQAKVWAMATTIGGLITLGWLSPLAALIALSTTLLYALVYTPMKVRSPYNTLVGSVVGALPPLIGWAAATGSLSFDAFCLALVLFVWQMPHFLSLAWMYREDYARGGYKMLGVVESSGHLTARMITFYCIALIPCSLLLVITGLAGWVFGLVSIALGLWMTMLALRFQLDVSGQTARKVFLGSLSYLALLMTVMMISHGAPAPSHQTWTIGSVEEPGVR